jgi:hypothetical protein
MIRKMLNIRMYQGKKVVIKRSLKILTPTVNVNAGKNTFVHKGKSTGASV